MRLKIKIYNNLKEFFLIYSEHKCYYLRIKQKSIIVLTDGWTNFYNKYGKYLKVLSIAKAFRGMNQNPVRFYIKTISKSVKASKRACLIRKMPYIACEFYKIYKLAKQFSCIASKVWF